MQISIEGGAILGKNYNTLDDYDVKDGAVLVVEQVEKMQR